MCVCVGKVSGNLRGGGRTVRSLLRETGGNVLFRGKKAAGGGRWRDYSTILPDRRTADFLSCPVQRIKGCVILRKISKLGGHLFAV